VTDKPLPTTMPALMLQPLVHVQDMAASVAFYERLGGSIIHGDRDENWVLMQVGTAQISLVAHPPNAQEGESAVELNFHSEMPLEQLEERLRETDVAVDIANDMAFGQQLQIKSPDGMLIKINQMEPGTYA
jgi:extradiol dioxygenase family protein